MTSRGLRFALLCAVAFVATALHAADLFPLYVKYQRAIDDDDAAAAKSCLSKGRRAQLEDLSDEEALAAMNVLSPKEDLRVHKEIVDGEDATLIVRANVAGNDSTGRIQLVKEKGAWKIVSEMWDIGGDPEDSQPGDDVRQPENEEQREAIRKLREMGFPSPTADFLVMSSVQGNLEAVKLFVQAGYSPDTKAQGSPAIVSAAMFGKPDVVLYLIEAGADVNAVDDVNTTALMRLADKCDSTETIRALIKAGARVDLKTAGGATAQQLAEWSSCSENVALIKAAAKKR